MDEPLAEVDTDKVNAELPSPVAGTIEKLLVSEGATVDVGTEIALVATSPRRPKPRRPSPSAGGRRRPMLLPRSSPPQIPRPSPSRRRRAARVAEARSRPGEGNGRGTVEDAETLRLHAVLARREAARRRARRGDLGDPRHRHGRPGNQEGHRGLHRAARSGGRRGCFARRGGRARSFRATRARGEAGAGAVHDGDRVEDLTGIRRAIANRMASSKAEIPHAWTLVEVDVTGLAALREREKEAFAGREGVKLTYLPFIVKAAVEASRSTRSSTPCGTGTGSS